MFILASLSIISFYLSVLFIFLYAYMQDLSFQSFNSVVDPVTSAQIGSTIEKKKIGMTNT